MGVGSSNPNVFSPNSFGVARLGLVPRRSGFDRLPGPTVKRGRPESEPVKFTATRLLGSARRCRGYGRAFETHAV